MNNEIPDLYYVKYKVQGRNWKYGIVQKFGEQAKKAWEKGNLLVEDAVKPILYAVPYAQTEFESIPFSSPEFIDGKFVSTNELDKYISKEYEKALKKAEESKTLKNKMFTVGVCDGFATYIVTKVNKKTAKVEWRAFSGGDRYRDQVLGFECTLPIEKVRGFVERHEALNKILAKR